jgi:uncharacterized protein YdaU (DUF1376 family)
VSGVSRFDCYPSDFLNGVVGLPADDIATYTVLVMLQYDCGGPVLYVGRERQIAVRCGMSKGRLAQSVDRLIKIGKLFLDADGAISNPRTRKELAKISERFAKNAQNSEKGGLATRQKFEEIRNNNNEVDRPNGQPTARPKQGPIPSSLPPPPIESSSLEKKNAGEKAEPSFESLCRKAVGEEPVLLDHKFSVLAAVLEEGATQDDVLAGIAAAMATPDFRIKHWSQLVGWAKRAAKDRLAGIPRKASLATTKTTEKTYDFGGDRQYAESFLISVLQNPSAYWRDKFFFGDDRFHEAVEHVAPHLLTFWKPSVAPKRAAEATA